MTEIQKLHFRWGDWLAIGMVVLAAVSVMLCFLPAKDDSDAYARIYLDGQLIKTVPLQADQTFTVEDRYSNEIAVVNGAIAFVDSNCPGRDCVHSGSIDRTGRSHPILLACR